MIMKKLLFIIAITLLCLVVKAQTPYYYYYEGEKQYLSLNTEYAFLSLKEQNLPVDIQQRNTVKIVRMEVYDLTNRKVHQQDVNQSYSTLKMNELAQGIYILKVWMDNGDMVVRKVIKE
jgi:hypothetical protein